jgi:hypothetical protein
MSAALRDLLARLRHDLGKYVALQARCLADDASADDLRQALIADVVQTRRSRAGIESAPAIWAVFRPMLVGELPLPDGAHVFLAEDPAVVEIDRQMGVLASLIEALASNSTSVEELERGAAASRAVADAIRALQRRRGIL